MALFITLILQNLRLTDLETYETVSLHSSSRFVRLSLGKADASSDDSGVIVRNLRVKIAICDFFESMRISISRASPVVFTKVVVVLIGLALGGLTPEMCTAILIVALVI